MEFTEQTVHLNIIRRDGIVTAFKPRYATLLLLTQLLLLVIIVLNLKIFLGSIKEYVCENVVDF